MFSPPMKRHLAVSRNLSTEEVRDLARTGKVRKALKLREVEECDKENLFHPHPNTKETFAVHVTTEDLLEKLLEARLKNLELDLNSWKKRVEQLEHSESTLQSCVEQLKHSESTLQSCVEQLKHSESTLQSRVEDLEGYSRSLEYRLDQVETPGQAVNIRFLLQYAFQVIEHSIKATSQDTGKGANIFKAFLESAPASLNLPIQHPALPLHGAVQVSRFAELLSHHGGMYGALSNKHCHSGSLKTIAAAIDGQVEKCNKGEVGVLRLEELLQLQQLYVELFGVSTAEASTSKEPMYIQEFFLPYGNRKV